MSEIIYITQKQFEQYGVVRDAYKAGLITRAEFNQSKESIKFNIRYNNHLIKEQIKKEKEEEK